MSWSHTLLGIALLAACAAPRTMTQSGRVTPRGEFRPSVSMNYNVGLASAGAILDGTKSAVGDIAETEGAISDKTVNKAVRAAVAYSLDPTFSAGTQLGLRYGVYERFDLGYNYAAGTHVLDARFQFLDNQDKPPGAKNLARNPVLLPAALGCNIPNKNMSYPVLRASTNSQDGWALKCHAKTS